ncbi:MAG: ABC transporter permease subunit [Acidobacteria bacterium]|jgi:ABC-2 type transport system permease protein|nr:ABC transporter permease subunit [Acidobacteriota bacterium]
MKNKTTENVKNIFKKEFKSYFVSPIAYIVISIFLLIMGWLFFSTFFLNDQASLVTFFALLPPTFAFIIPAVTMRLFSEEMNVGSYELLLTLPVTFRDIIMGKFFAAVAFVAVMLAPTLVYAITVALMGSLDWGPVFGSYLGALLLGAAFSAIGLLASSMTRNQVVAFIIGMAICVSLALLTDFLLYFLPHSLISFFQYFSAKYHFSDIAKGVIDSRNILYFLSVIFVALYGVNLIMQEKK